jgi:serralysin
MPTDTDGFQRFNTAQILQAEQALQAWADVANIRFIRVGSGSSTDSDAAYTDQATILFSNYSTGESGSAAFAYYPGNVNFGSSSGDVWINIGASSNAFPTPGNYGAGPRDWSRYRACPSRRLQLERGGQGHLCRQRRVL